jgi:hypothetical protein
MSGKDQAKLKPGPSADFGMSGVLQRKCACGQHTVAGGECEECGKKKGALQRTACAAYEDEVPPIVHQVLHSPGQPLDTATRALFEPRMGRVLGESQATAHAPAPQKLSVSQPGDFHEQEADRLAERVVEPHESLPPERLRQSAGPMYDLSRVRIHTDERAAQSAQAVNALAFTVGQQIVFGRGLYSPHSPSGQRLLAHELAHTAQQSQGLARQTGSLMQHAPKSPVSLMRACANATVCKDVKTPLKLLAEAGAESKDRREKRKKQCEKVPEDAGCRSDGHAARAVELEKLLGAYDATRLKNARGIFVDKDLESDFGSVTTSCKKFTPPLAPDGTCIVVPAKMEEDAGIFNSTTGPLNIGGMERGLWRERVLEKLVHEVGHVDFRTSFLKDFSDKFGFATPNILGKSRPTCKSDEDSKINVFQSLNELAAMVQEFPLRIDRIRTSVSFANQEEKDAEMKDWTDHRITGTSQSITNSVKVVRCLCGCKDADSMIQETIKFATSSWTESERKDLHSELLNPKWSSLKLDWPFDASGAPKTP